MKTITGKVTETVTVSKSVTVEVPDDANEFFVEQAIRNAAYEKTVATDTGWEIMDSFDTDVSVIPPADVEVTNNGSLFTFRLLTDAAKAWVEENVHIEDYMWMGDSTFHCEPRYAGDITNGMQAEGLVVQ